MWLLKNISVTTKDLFYAFFFLIGIYAFQPSLMLSSHFIIQETSLVSQIWQECIVYLSQGKLITTKTIFEYQSDLNLKPQKY